MWASHGNLWTKGVTFWGYLLSQSPSARKPLPRVRKPNPEYILCIYSGPTYTRTVDRIRTCALGDPSDPKACMVPLYHGGFPKVVVPLAFHLY
ncbi:hypothetical protein E2C01_053515 [Portunus trituberculatus]|uniref:Uncharacterized protein n=1 Tax=Portunus trituberculatus TaxID=210409 RepID=A0A5B7GQA6_PORTR|nr:hypothetical protein [Portunus trituberculatus]